MSQVKQALKTIAAYWKGVSDYQAGRPKTPPKKEPFKTAYLNGYYKEHR